MGPFSRPLTTVDIALRMEQRMQQRRRTCIDCQTLELTGYMVKHSIWAEASLATNAGCLHVWCLEKRLGRPLQVEDLLDAPINSLVFYFLQGRICDRIPKSPRPH